MSTSTGAAPNGGITQASQENLRAAYAEVCTRYRAIDEFRAKLLGLLPLASGTGIFLLLNSTSDTVILTPVGVFGVAVTLGLYFYELRGIQYCVHLIAAGRALEDELRISGAFSTRPRQHVGGLISEISASHLIYGSVIAAWIFVASMLAGIVPASIAALVIATLIVGIAAQQNVRPDRVRIASVTANSPPRFGEAIELAIAVSADVKSAEQGFVELGFNSKAPECFEIVERRTVPRGESELCCAVKVSPVDWGPGTPFTVLACLRPGTGAATVCARRTISCALRAERAQA